MTDHSKSDVSKLVKRTHDLTEADYWTAVGLIILSQRASISFIQRKIGVGFNAASSLMDRMEVDKIVSAPNRVGKREVLVVAPRAKFTDYDPLTLIRGPDLRRTETAP